MIQLQKEKKKNPKEIVAKFHLDFVYSVIIYRINLIRSRKRVVKGSNP